MKRLSVLLAAVCILAALLAVPVFAAETSYQFEMVSSVSLLPDFSVSSDSQYVFCYDGRLPDGIYSAHIGAPDVADTIVFFDYLSVFLTPVDDSPSEYFVECISAYTFLGQYVVADVAFVYAADDDVTYAYVGSISTGTQIAWGEDAVLSLDLLFGNDSSEPLKLKQVIIDLFGPYEQQTETITETLADGSTVTTQQRIPGIAGLDYEWIASVVLFGLALLCFFRILGGLIKQ